MAMTEQRTIHQPKSPEARHKALMAFAELERSPFGSKPGENVHVAANYMPAPALVYMVNHSRTREWKRVTQPVSTKKGADERLARDPELRKTYNPDMLYNAVAQGRDMNGYETSIKPVVFKFLVGGDVILVPPAKNADEKPPKVEVPEGAMDLFIGNYDRMKGIVRDNEGKVIREGEPSVIGDERARMAIMWRRRHNPIFRFVDDEDTRSWENEFGFLEFIRETRRPATELMDKEFLTALDLVEAV